jgi:hypothetical protein
VQSKSNQETLFLVCIVYSRCTDMHTDLTKYPLFLTFNQTFKFLVKFHYTQLYEALLEVPKLLHAHRMISISSKTSTVVDVLYKNVTVTATIQYTGKSSQ